MHISKRVSVLTLVAAVVAGGAIWLNPMHVHAAQPTAAVEPQVVAPATDLAKAFRAVHDRLAKAVVNINIDQRVSSMRNNSRNIPEELRRMLPPGMVPDDNGDDNDSQDLSPRNNQRRPNAPKGDRMVQAGLGSGVVVSADGYILTNNHVVEKADRIRVVLDDGREVEAKIIGRDPKTDLAVVKIDVKDLTYAKLGDSDTMQVGDWVLAFGSPFGFSQTMTQGIVSAKGRNTPIIASNNPKLIGLTYENFIQTDAAINPGNSGGPLVNLKGEVIGINTAIASRSGAYNGIGFAIPANDAKYVMDQLIRHGKVTRGYLGVRISDVHDSKVADRAKAVGFTGDKGVFIEEVQADTPGGSGGLKPGDVIIAIDGRETENTTQLRNQIARTAPGTKVTVTVMREGKKIELSFPVGTQPDVADAMADAAKEKSSPNDNFDLTDLGITVQEQNGKLVVTNVDDQGLAAVRGVSRGDTIEKVQGKEVKTIDELNAVLAKRKISDGVYMIVRTKDGAQRFIYVQKE